MLNWIAIHNPLSYIERINSVCETQKRISQGCFTVINVRNDRKIANRRINILLSRHYFLAVFFAAAFFGAAFLTTFFAGVFLATAFFTGAATFAPGFDNLLN